MTVPKTAPPTFLALFLGLVLLLLAGCHSTSPTPTPSIAEPGGPSRNPLVLTLWHSEGGAAREALDGMANDLHKAYPDLTLLPVYVGNAADLSKKVAAAIALGQTPDLVLAPRREIAGFARQGGLVPLDGLFQAPSAGLSDEDQTDLFPGVMDEGAFVEFGGQHYGFPLDLDGMALYYNSGMLEAKQLKPPVTWAEFLDVASKVTQDEQYGWAMPITADTFEAMLVSQGSALVDAPEHRALFAERGGLAVMTLAAQLSQSGAAHSKGSRADAVRDFAAGKAAFYFDWLSARPEIEAAKKKAGADFSIGVANLPQRDPGSPSMLVAGSDLALFSLAPERLDRAWFVIRWLTASAQAARWAQSAQSLPLRVSALALLDSQASGATPLQQIRTSPGGTVPHFVPRPAHSRIDDVEHLAEDAWLQALRPKADIATILTNASSTANTILAGVQ